jgi:uncharacterized protein (TIGR03437 family)
MRIKNLLTVGTAVVVTIWVIHAARLSADTGVTYTYKGNKFTSGGPPYTTADSITGYFTAPPLAPNLTAMDITSTVIAFSFSDGINTWDQTNTNPIERRFVISTDSQSNIIAWDVGVSSNVPSPNNDAIVTCNGISTYFNSCPDHPYDEAYEGNGQYEGYNQSAPGTWSSTASSGGMPAITGIVSGASFQPGVVPGSWITITGTNLSPVTDTWATAITNGNLPTSLDGVTVSIAGQPAYIAYISSTQINAVAPDVGTGTVPVAVTTPAGTSPAVMAIAQAVQPAFFQWGNYAVATHQDYSLAAKNGAFSGLATASASPGETIILWGTGFGATAPVAPVGVELPSDGVYYTANAVTVTIGSTPATVYAAALSPGFAGLYQVAIQIPPSLPSGDYPVVASVSGVSSPSTTLLTVAVPQIQSLSFSANTAASGATVMASLMLSAAAPPGGAVVSLSSSDSLASLPATVTVPAGTASLTVSLSVGAVTANETIAITASYGGNSVQASLTLTPPVDPQCANISGNWNGSESGSATFSIVAPIETDMFTDPVSGSGTVAIMQTGCSIQYEPFGESALTGTNLTPSQLAELMRTGTISGNNISITGILALPDMVELAAEGVTSIQVSTNVVNGAGQLADGVISVSETGMFAASGTYSYNGQTGSFTLTVTSSSVGTLDAAFGNRPAAKWSSAARRARLMHLRVAPGHESFDGLLRAALNRALIFAPR